MKHMRLALILSDGTVTDHLELDDYLDDNGRVPLRATLRAELVHDVDDMLRRLARRQAAAEGKAIA